MWHLNDWTRVRAVAAAFCVSLTTAAASNGSVIFVDGSAPPGGDGTSWEQAFRDLHDALSIAGGGNEVWVRAGTYLPTTEGGPLDSTFVIPSGAALYGGFAGGETEREQRDWVLNKTILSGDLIGNDDVCDVGGGGIGGETCEEAGQILAGRTPIDTTDAMSESAQCDISNDVWFRYTSICQGSLRFAVEAYVFDGRIAVYDGTSCPPGDPLRCGTQAILSTEVGQTYLLQVGGHGDEEAGPGWVNIRTDVKEDNVRHVVTAIDATATIDGFVVQGGYAAGSGETRRGGGLFLMRSDVEITNCTLRDNYGIGAAVYNLDGNVELTDCVISDNDDRAMSTEGGSFAMDNCTVSDNEGQGALVCLSPLLATECRFERNDGLNQGGAVVVWGVGAILTQCVFVDNTARSAAALLSASQASVVLTECSFTGNHSDDRYWWGGGAVANTTDSDLHAVRCHFEANVGPRGGAVWNDSEGRVTLEACTFVGNVAEHEGGALLNDAYAQVMGGTFAGNHAGTEGGAIESRFDGDLLVMNASVSGNTAGTNYAIAFGSGAIGTITSSSIFGNTAGGSVGGIGFPFATVSIVNNILWQNSGFQLTTFSDPEVSYNCIEGMPVQGNGNIGDDPGFVDPDGPDGVVGTLDDDLRLRGNSPCIDAGDNEAVPFGVTTDHDGDPRFIDDSGTPDTGRGDPPIVDMGAYEFQGISCRADVDDDGAVGFSDLLFVLTAWGPCDGCPEDVDDNGAVGFSDVLVVLAEWGPCEYGSTRSR